MPRQTAYRRRAIKTDWFHDFDSGRRINRNTGVIIRSTFKPERAIIENIPKMHELVMRRAFFGASTMARAAEVEMKANAPYEDQPDDKAKVVGKGNHQGGRSRNLRGALGGIVYHVPPRYPGPHAREGIFCRATREGDVITVVAGYDPSVIHKTKKGRKYTYGGILEADIAGAPTAIIVPTMEKAIYQKISELLLGGGRTLGFSGNVLGQKMPKGGRA